MKRIALISSIAIASSLAFAPVSSAATPSRLVTVNAEGTVKVIPDAVRLNASVSVVAASNKEALVQVATGANAFRNALKANGVSTKDIATQSVSTYPEYSYSADGGSKLVGYRGSQSFVVTIRNSANAGTIVDAVVDAGGDTLQINGVTPFVLDASKSTYAARSAAVKNAKAKALSYAKLLGVKLGKVVTVTENSAPAAYPIIAMAKDSAGATSIDLGQQDVTVSITVAWSLI